MKSVFVLFVLIFLLCVPSFAFNCESISTCVDDSWRYIKRASEESSLDGAQTYMRKARNSLDEASYAARDCGCDQAAMEFDDASTKARRARDAIDANDFSYQFDRCVRSLKSGIQAFNACVQARQ